MKKSLINLTVSLFLLCITSCNFWTDADLVIRRSRNHLDLSKPSTDAIRKDEKINYQNLWYIFKYDKPEILAGDTVTIKLTGVPEYNIPAVHTYFAEYKDINLTSCQKAKDAKEDENYVTGPVQWVKISDEIQIFDSGTQNAGFESEIVFTFDFDVIDKDKVVLLLYIDEDTLPEDYFDYYEKLLEEAEIQAKENAKKKAEKVNSKEKLTEGDAKYHTEEEYYESEYKLLLAEIGEKRVRINDIKLFVEIRNANQ